MKKLISRRFSHAMVVSVIAILVCFFFTGCVKHSSSVSSTGIKEAEILYDMGKNQEALDFYNQKLAGNSTDFASYITRGKILVKLGRYDDAINDFYKASKLDNSQSTFMLYKGLVTMQSAIDVNTLDALNFTGAANLDMYTFYRCALMYKLNQIKDTNLCLDKLLAIDNNNPQGNYLKAIVFTQIGKWKSSIKYFDKAEQGGIATEALYTNKAIALAESDMTGAIEYANKSLNINSNNTGGLYAKALALFNTEQYKEGLKYIDKAILIYTGKIDYYILKGDLLTELTNYGQAIVSYDKALTIDTKDSDILAKKALAQYKAGDKKAMEDTLIQAKSIVPNNIYKYTNLSTVLIVVGKYDDAMIYIDKALAINPKDTYAEFNKTLDYYMLGKLADANVRYHNLRGTNTVTYEDKIIFANYKLGNADYVGASTLIDEVLKVDPTNEMALATKVKLYSEMHKAGKTVTDKTFDYTTPAVVDAAMNKLNKYWFLKNYR